MFIGLSLSKRREATINGEVIANLQVSAKAVGSLRRSSYIRSNRKEQTVFLKPFIWEISDDMGGIYHE
jgi:hypothetical protein